MNNTEIIKELASTDVVIRGHLSNLAPDVSYQDVLERMVISLKEQNTHLLADLIKTKAQEAAPTFIAPTPEKVEAIRAAYEQGGAKPQDVYQAVLQGRELLLAAWRLMDGQDHKTAEWHLLTARYLNKQVGVAITIPDWQKSDCPHTFIDFVAPGGCSKCKAAKQDQTGNEQP